MRDSVAASTAFHKHGILNKHQERWRKTLVGGDSEQRNRIYTEVGRFLVEADWRPSLAIISAAQKLGGANMASTLDEMAALRRMNREEDGLLQQDTPQPLRKLQC